MFCLLAYAHHMPAVPEEARRGNWIPGTRLWTVGSRHVSVLNKLQGEKSPKPLRGAKDATAQRGETVTSPQAGLRSDVLGETELDGRMERSIMHLLKESESWGCCSPSYCKVGGDMEKLP